MAMIKYREHVEQVSYRLAFDYVGERGWGFAFDCDAAGNVNAAALNEGSQRTYIACLTGTVDGRAVGKPYVDERHTSYVEPGELKCNCGRTVVLDDTMTNKCRCGSFYNGSGQLLSHPRNWGEETGERFDDEGGLIL